MAEILSSCPVLEFLKLRTCKGINRLNIASSSNLKELVIESLICEVSPIEILAPNIRSISLLGCIYRAKYKLIDVSSLMEANLSFRGYSYYSDLVQQRCHMLNGFLEKLSHVQKLTMGPWYLAILSKCNVQSPIFRKLKSLTIESSINESELPSTASMLENTPELEKLTININMPSANKVEHGGKRSWTSKERFCKCLCCHLKIIEITGFQPSFEIAKSHCSSVEFLLNNAKVLEKMAIHIEPEYFCGFWVRSRLEKKVKDIVEVNRLILSYRRASSNAVVLVDNPFN